ncbi:HD-GYP domain-containing protein, partial [Gemmatimonadota bacterium]
ASLLALALLSEVFSTQMLRSTATMAVSFVPYIATMVLLGGPWAMAVAGLTGLIAESIIRRKQMIKILHNTSKEVVAIGVAGMLYASVGGVPCVDAFEIDPFGFGIAVSAYFIISNGTTATAMALSTGSTLKEMWGRAVAKTFLYDLLASSLALLLVFLYVQLEIFGLFLVIVPLFFVRHTNHINIRLEETNRDLLELMVKAIEARDPYTCGHSQRVARLASAIAREVGVGFKEVEHITTAALLHDVGKIYEEFAPLLRKPACLTESERVLMESHPGRSAELVSTISSLRGAIEQSVRHHHEHFDGTGYPAGLAGQGIPLGARIVAIADTADAMTTDRPYRRALTFDSVLAELNVHSGRQFDPQLVDAFRRSAAVRAMYCDREQVVSPLERASAGGWRLRIAR